MGRSTSTPIYHLSPSFTIPPESVALGQIITDPSDPLSCLNTDDVMAISRKDVVKSLQGHWSFSSRQLVNAGIFGKFLQIIGLGDNIRSRDESVQIEATELETIYFLQKDAYVAEIMKSSGVHRFLSASRFKKPVYMITGIKIARGVKISRSSRTSSASWRDQDVGVNFSGPEDGAVGIPVGVNQGLSYDKASDCVFAYRLTEIKWKKKATMEFSARPSSPSFEAVAIDEDVGAEGIEDVVVEQVEEDDTASEVVYSARNYNKRALF